jgi:hypothetical protein
MMQHVISFAQHVSSIGSVKPPPGNQKVSQFCQTILNALAPDASIRWLTAELPMQLNRHFGPKARFWRRTGTIRQTQTAGATISARRMTPKPFCKRGLCH